MPKVHELKIWPQYFGPVEDGRQNFQLRRNDRDYQEGDLLRLREWEPPPANGNDGLEDSHYTGREVLVRVDHIMRVFDFGEWPPPVNPDFVIMGTSRVEA